MNSRIGIAVVGLGFLLAACGSTTSDRAVSGAAIGAAGGAIAGAFLGAPAFGAAAGALAGSVTGVATSASQVDFGKPVWE
jgi:osmotically inducible lipoprotein OsmB